MYYLKSTTIMSHFVIEITLGKPSTFQQINKGILE